MYIFVELLTSNFQTLSNIQYPMAQHHNLTILLESANMGGNGKDDEGKVLSVSSDPIFP